MFFLAGGGRDLINLFMSKEKLLACINPVILVDSNK